MLSALRVAAFGAVGVSAMTPESFGERMRANKAVISSRRDGEPGFIEITDAISRHSEKLSKKEYTPFNKDTRSADTAKERDSFFEQYGVALGVTKSQLKEIRANHAVLAGISNFYYDQYIEGYKVFGGDVVATVGSNNEVMRAHGTPLEIADIPRDATIGLVYSTVETVRDIVSAHLGEGYTLNDGLTAETVWYRSDLLLRGETGVVSLVVHVQGSADRVNNLPMRFDAFVDAKTGVVVDFIDKTGQFFNPESLNTKKKNLRSVDLAVNKVASALADPAIGSLKVTETDDPTNKIIYQYPSTVYPADPEGKEAIVNTYFVTYLMRSISNQELQTWHGDNSDLRIIVNIEDYFNANFDGQKINIGDGLAVDDVMAHEWGHGYTDTLNGLVYRGQSGALNEAYSDIWGESMDLLQDASDKPLRSVTQTCTNGNWDFEIKSGTDTGHRWLMGEDIDGSPTASCTNCAIRDMYYPECFGNPSTTKSSYYYCGRSDNGGVHINSGVINRLFATLVDGGQQGTKTIKPIGHTKALALFLNVAEGLTSSAQFADFAALMLSTCSAMVGTPIYLPDLETGASVSTTGLVQGDCMKVKGALVALNVPAKVCNS